MCIQAHKIICVLLSALKLIAAEGPYSLNLGDSMNKHTTSVSVGGKELIFETGRLARQADGSVLVTVGETMILSTACTSPSAADIDFLPLRVDYQEKFSSAGKTLGGFIKREGKPTERETLTCRLIDRPIRPMFEDGFYDEVQLISTVLSYDGVHTPDPVAICAASAALTISSIPLIKPIGAVRVGMIDDAFVINPTVEEMEASILDLVIAGTEDAILMIEGYCDFLSEEKVIEAIEEGHEAIKSICECLSDWQNEVGKPKNRTTLRILPQELLNRVEELVKEPIQPALTTIKKQEREEALADVNKLVMDTLLPNGEEVEFSKIFVQRALKKVSSKYMRDMVLSTKKRCDGRSLDEIRTISVDMDPLPRTHGSTVFTRGETQTIAVCTLGPEAMGQRFEDLNSDGLRRFYLQYSFPPFSVGEVGRMGPPGRREVGHGKLAERALAAAIPSQDDFPYTIRLESNITESNGSSSMASVCGGCLAMMSAGVKIKRPIAGIAMGLILENQNHVILSDILGIEDALGDMDFKITGDANGITAFQMDIKVEGITREIMAAALMQAKQGRTHILQKMLEVCPQSKTTLSQYAPKIETMKIVPSKIGVVIGPGGKQIRAIVEETGVEVDINDDGIVSFSSTDQEAIDKAKDIVYNLTAEPEVGKTYKGKVVSIKEFGLFVAVLSKEGLCHISEVAHERVDNLEGMFKIGDPIEVKVIEVNDRGQLRLSRKALLEGGPSGGSSSNEGQRPPRGDRPKSPRRHAQGDNKGPRKPHQGAPKESQKEGTGKINILPPPPLKDFSQE